MHRVPAGRRSAATAVRVLALAAVVLAAGCGGSGAGGSGVVEPGPAADPLVSRGPAAVSATAPRGQVDAGWRVSRVVDGDTVWVSRAGTRVKVRLIGIDTPETVDPGEPVGCFGAEASAFAVAELADRAVALEYDESQGREDRYGRTLAYLWTVGPDGRPERMYQVAALEAGAAREYTHDRPYAWRTEFLAAQTAAQVAGRGLWSACPSPAM